MKYSKRVLILLCVIFSAIAFSGCKGDKLPSNSYHVGIEDVFEMSNFILKKLTITTEGTRRLHIQLSPGNGDMHMIEPVKGSKYAKATILVVAEKITTDKTTFVLLRWPITKKGGKASGCSALIELLEPGNLEDEFEIMLEPGLHPIDQTMDFARIHDRTYSILID